MNSERTFFAGGCAIITSLNAGVCIYSACQMVALAVCSHDLARAAGQATAAGISGGFAVCGALFLLTVLAAKEKE